MEVCYRQNHFSACYQHNEEQWPNASLQNREAVAQLLRELLQATDSTLVHYQSDYFDVAIELESQAESDFWKPGWVES